MPVYKECERCPGYCCLSSDTLRTPLKGEDIVRMANHFRISVDDFIGRFVSLTNGRMRYDNAPLAIGHFKPVGPCPFLRGGLCGIHRVKPQACSDMPTDYLPRVTCAELHKARIGWLKV